MTAAGDWMVPTVMLRRPAKRHPRRLLIWLPRRTVQAQGRRRRLRARLTVRFFKRKQRCRRTWRLLNKDLEEPDILPLNAQFRGLAERCRTLSGAPFTHVAR